MKPVILQLFLTCLLSTASAQVNIIFDTDFGGDADDLAALAMLHNLEEKGECDLLAVMCWSTEKYAVAGIDAVNRWYNQADTPIGTRQEGIHEEPFNYGKPLAQAFVHQLNHDSVPDVVQLYREVLASQPDSSVIIVTVGPLLNIQNLLQSPADEFSPLDGKALIERKVKEFVIMGGKFPQGDWEWNFNGGMPGVTKFVIGELKVPVTFSGYEVGLPIKTGKILNDIPGQSPLKVGYAHFSQYAPWMKDNYKGKIQDNASYDQTAVLYAVRGGLGEYWQKVNDGYCLPDSTGGNQWVAGDKYKHSYLKLITPPNKVAGVIESIMLDDF